MSEIKVGEYVRTKKGLIRKVTNVINDVIEIDKGYYDEENEYGDSYFDFLIENEIAKHSPNIIDLIEVGDYVNGYQVIREPYIYYHIQFIPIDTQDNWGWGEGIMPLSDVDIKSIVTK